MQCADILPFVWIQFPPSLQRCVMSLIVSSLPLMLVVDFQHLIIRVHIICYIFTMTSVISCRFILKIFEKRRVYESFAALNVALSFALFCCSFSNSTFHLYVVTMISMGVVLFTLSSLKYLFIRDVAVCDTFETGNRREGIYQLAVQVSEGIMATICQAVPQILLPYMGWREVTNRISSDDLIVHNYVSTTRAVWMLRFLSAGAIGIFSVISYESIRKYQLQQSAVDEMIQVIRNRESTLPRLEKDYLLLLHLSNCEILSLAFKKDFAQKMLRRMSAQNTVAISLGLLSWIILLLSTGVNFIYMDEAMISLSLVAMLISSMHILYNWLRRSAFISLSRFDDCALYMLALSHMKRCEWSKRSQYRLREGYSTITGSVEAEAGVNFDDNWQEFARLGVQTQSFYSYLVAGIYLCLISFGITSIVIKLFRKSG